MVQAIIGSAIKGPLLKVLRGVSTWGHASLRTAAPLYQHALRGMSWADTLIKYVGLECRLHLNYIMPKIEPQKFGLK